MGSWSIYLLRVWGTVSWQGGLSPHTGPSFHAVESLLLQVQDLCPAPDNVEGKAKLTSARMWPVNRGTISARGFTWITKFASRVSVCIRKFNLCVHMSVLGCVPTLSIAWVGRCIPLGINVP